MRWRLARDGAGEKPEEAADRRDRRHPGRAESPASDKIQVTVFEDAVGQGKTALAVALKLIKGEKVESHVWIPFELVTKENMQTYVEKSH